MKRLALLLFPAIALAQQVVYEYRAAEGTIMRVPVREEYVEAIKTNTNGVYRWAEGESIRDATTNEIVQAVSGLDMKVSTGLPAVSLVEDASLFRYLYEARFGAGAVTNRNLAYSDVAKHFTVRRLAGLLTDNDNADMAFFSTMVSRITEYTGDGTIWSFPWEFVPVFTMPEELP